MTGHVGPTGAELDRRIAAAKSALAALPDAERMAIEDGCKRLRDQIANVGPLTALEIMASLGMWLAERDDTRNG